MKSQSTKVRAPKGFSFDVKEINISDVDKYYVIQLIENKKQPQVIGTVRLRKSVYYKNFYETHSNLHEKFHGRGLGSLLYARAIQFALENNLKIKSSGYSSVQAENVWRGNSIRKYFRIVRKPTKMHSSYSTWFAYKKR